MRMPSRDETMTPRRYQPARVELHCPAIYTHTRIGGTDGHPANNHRGAARHESRASAVLWSDDRHHRTRCSVH
jgi:hypothetical protein